jgi:hypothetical protein
MSNGKERNESLFEEKGKRRRKRKVMERITPRRNFES